MENHLRISTTLFLIVGIGSYFAWSPSAVITSALWPDASDFYLKLNWTFNLAGHTCALGALSLLAPKIAPLTRTKAWGAFAATLVALCTVALAVGFMKPTSTLVIASAAFFSGVGMAMLLFVWSEALVALSTIEFQHLVIEASVITGLLLTVVIICLPPLFGVLMCLVLPFVVCHCSAQAREKIEGESCQNAVGNADCECDLPQTSMKAADARDIMRSKVLLLVCCFVLALPAGMYQATDTAAQGLDAANGWRTILAINCVVVTAAVLVDHRLLKRDLSRLFSRLIVPLMAGGLLVISLMEPGLERWGGCVMQVGYQLFLIYVYTEFAYAAMASDSFPVRAFSVGTFAIDSGLFAGFFLLSYTTLFQSDWVQGSILAIVYLLLLVGILVFPRVVERGSLKAKKNRRVVFDQDAGAFDSATLNAPSSAQPSTLEERAAACSRRYRLSAREEEILRHLVRGRTLPSIAGETCLSYNTVKTHVSHIYQKVGVHTRDELLDELEASGSAEAERRQE